MTLSSHPSIQKLFELRRRSSAAVPPPAAVPEFIDYTLGALFPQLSPSPALSPETLATLVSHAQQQLEHLLSPVVSHEATKTIREEFLNALPSLHAAIMDDATAIFAGDPAAKSVDEIIVAYPGFYATAVYRVAHWLLQQGVPTVPRMLTEYAHRITGVDIHPGAAIGSSFVIDHGTGVFIGETTIIHEHVKIYQGVTLGALSVAKSMANKKRHPTIEKNVVIYANATILGGDTVVGEGSVIGGNVWITQSVAPKSRVYHRADPAASVS